MWLALTLTSFTTFLLALFGFVWLGLERTGKVRPRGPLFLLAAVMSFGIWVFALLRVPTTYPISNLNYYVPPASVDPGPPAHPADHVIPD